MKHKYNYFYKITNKINGKFYYGIHSTNNLNDNYLGSGSRLMIDKKKYGKENFVKEILKFFDTREEASDYESEVVTESLVYNDECYNIKIGGDFGTTVGTVLCINKDGKYYRCTCEEYKDENHKQFSKGFVFAHDENGNKVQITTEEYNNNKDRYNIATKGKITVRYLSGNTFCTTVDNIKLLNKEIVPIWTGRKHTEETKKKMRETYSRTNHQKGEKNSSYGTCWITNGAENKKCKKEELDKYLCDGWKKGRLYDTPQSSYKTQNRLDKDDIIKRLNNKEKKVSIARSYGINKTQLYAFLKRMNIPY